MNKDCCDICAMRKEGVVEGAYVINGYHKNIKMCKKHLIELYLSIKKEVESNKEVLNWN